MDKEYKVKVSSQVDATVGLSLANRNFKREWTKRGQAMSIPFEIIEEAIFDNGFKNMLDQGILHIDDLAAMKALGLEPEDASAPVNYKVYSDAEITKMLNVTPYLEFEQKFTEMPKEQQLRLADMAADLKLRDDKKIGLIKKTLGIDIDKEIAFINSMKEE